MNSTGPSKNRSVSLLNGTAFPANAYYEHFSDSATLRDHWKGLIETFDTADRETLGQRQERVRRMRHEDGATYNPFDTPSGKGTPWALEMIPLPITASEWAELEAGLIQRARLLERILADVYGPQNLVKDGALPAELVFANPNFLHSCHGITPVGNRFLTYYAADLYRGEDGRFRVFRDYGSHPSGLGYALENRIVISRVFSDLYHKTQIRRLAPFFQTFHQSLIARAALRREDPGIVLLSPGPDSRIYFEQALLSRYLGYPLVEGQDLTVRNGEVFLKKLAGLEPVEVIFRHISDDESDPFTLRKGAAVGVAGLIQAFREGRIEIVNPIGAGFVDTPALSIFLSDLCFKVLGEKLSLESHPARWSGAAHDREGILSDRDRPPMAPSVAPAWTPDGIASRYALFRIFACATDSGFCVMPGGLAITAPDVRTLTEGVPEAQESKDIWVLSDRPVTLFSLMSGLQSVAEVKRGSDLPSRVADHLLWLGRYLERAEGGVRVLRSIFRRLSGEADFKDLPELPFLLDLLRSKNIIPSVTREDGGLLAHETLVAHLDVALYQQDRPESVVAVLRQVREAARNVRDRLSPDAWRVIHRLDGLADRSIGDPLELLDDTLFTLSAFSGLAMESMTRGLGWRFMDMGRRVERAIHQSAMVRIGLPRMCNESRSTLEALLEVADSIMTYRARYRTTFQLAPVLDLLLMDESNPKSLAFQCSQLAAHVEVLPRQSDRRFDTVEERLALEMLTAVRLLTLDGLDGRSCVAENGDVAVFLESMQIRLKAFAQRICAHYLSRVPLTPHFSAISGEPGP